MIVLRDEMKRGFKLVKKHAQCFNIQTFHMLLFKKLSNYWSTLRCSKPSAYFLNQRWSWESVDTKIVRFLGTIIILVAVHSLMKRDGEECIDIEHWWGVLSKGFHFCLTFWSISMANSIITILGRQLPNKSPLGTTMVPLWYWIIQGRKETRYWLVNQFTKDDHNCQIFNLHVVGWLDQN